MCSGRDFALDRRSRTRTRYLHVDPERAEIDPQNLVRIYMLILRGPKSTNKIELLRNCSRISSTTSGTVRGDGLPKYGSGRVGPAATAPWKPIAETPNRNFEHFLKAKVGTASRPQKVQGQFWTAFCPLPKRVPEARPGDRKHYCEPPWVTLVGCRRPSVGVEATSSLPKTHEQKGRGASAPQASRSQPKRRRFPGVCPPTLLSMCPIGAYMCYMGSEM